MEDDDEILDPEELAVWKKHEEKLKQDAGYEEQLIVKAPHEEPVRERTTDSSRGNSPLRSSGTLTLKDAKGKNYAGIKNSVSRWRKKNPQDSPKPEHKEKNRETTAKSKEHARKEDKRKKQMAKKIERQHKALEKQKFRLAKENAKLLAAQSPPLAVGTASRRASTDHLDLAEIANDTAQPHEGMEPVPEEDSAQLKKISAEGKKSREVSSNTLRVDDATTEKNETRKAQERNSPGASVDNDSEVTSESVQDESTETTSEGNSSED